jgi:transcriptional regulator with XRE-family HTH domain
MKKSLGNLVLETRESLGLDRATVAAKCGIHASTLRDIETGRIARPPRERLELLAKALKLSVSELESACEEKQTFDSQVRTAREAKGLSLAEVAEKAGINPSTLSDIETGRIKSPSKGKLHRLSKVLGVSLTAFLASLGLAFNPTPAFAYCEQNPLVAVETKEKTLYVASFGGGTDSTAMIVDWVNSGKSLDLVLFADTGAELPSTYAFVELFDAWLKNHGQPGVTVVHYVNRNGERWTLEQECVTKKMLPSLAYGYKKCSLKHKRSPQDKFCNHWEPARALWKEGYRVTKLIGYNANETRRALKTDETEKKYTYRYPLMERGIGKEDCKTIILSAGLPLPGKSACYFCPARKKTEIVELREKNPELFQKALALEDNARPNLKKVAGLGRYFSWHDLERIDDTCSVDCPCGCFDG